MAARRETSEERWRYSNIYLSDTGYAWLSESARYNAKKWRPNAAWPPV